MISQAVVVVSDGNYHHHAENLISSLAITNQLHICWIQLGDGNVSENFRIGESNGISVLKKQVEGGSAEARRTYAAICRFALIDRIFEANTSLQSIFYIDADSIVRGRIDDLFSRFEESGAVIGLRTRKDDRHPYLAGFLLFNRDRSRDLLGILAAELKGVEHSWGADQDALFKYVSTEFIFEIEPSFASWDFRRSLRVWSAKGHSRRRQPEFLFETKLVKLLSRFSPKISQRVLPLVQLGTVVIHSLHLRENYYLGRSLLSRVRSILRL